MLKTIGLINPPPFTLDSDYGLPFRDQGTVYQFSEPKYACKFDLIVFPGGPDVDPSLYGEKPHPRTYYIPERDKFLDKIYTIALSNNIPMVGICGGMQFLAVMNGCKLIQDTIGHRNNTHKILIFNEKINKDVYDEILHGQVIKIKGDHHQAVGSEEIINHEGNLLANDYGSEIVEACWFPKTKCLGVQYHPEWMSKDSKGYKYFQELLEKFIYKNV